jgi:hypothetical protein
MRAVTRADRSADGSGAGTEFGVGAAGTGAALGAGGAAVEMMSAEGAGEPAPSTLGRCEFENVDGFHSYAQAQGCRPLFALVESSTAR